MRRTRAWMLGLAVSLACGVARAQDGAKPPAPPAPADAPPNPVDADVDALRKLVVAGQWKQGAEFARTLFTKHEGNLRLLARIDEIEEDMAACAWRAVRPELSGAAIVGCGAEKVNLKTREAEFRFASLADADGWSAGGSVRVFRVPFDDVTVSFDYANWFTSTATTYTALPPPAVILDYDSEREGGYAASIVFERIVDSGRDTFVPSTGRILRWGADERIVAKGTKSELLDSAYPLRVEAAERSGTVSLRLNGKLMASGTEASNRSGAVAFSGIEDALPKMREIVLKGRLTATYLTRVVNEAEDRRYRAWREESWDAAREIPEWVRKAQDEAESRRALLPSDASDEQRNWFRAAWDDLESGDPKTIASIRIWLKDAPPRTGAYLQAVLDHVRGDAGTVETRLRKLLTDEPDFGPGWALLAVSAAEGENREAAAAALRDAKERAGHHAWTWEAAATEALRAGDLEGLRVALDAAAEHAAGSPALTELRAVLLRLRRGPAWAKRFQAETPHFVVLSDHSLAVCKEIGAMLEDARLAYAQNFRPRDDGRKARVLVFSGEDSYQDYVWESGSSAENTLGVYRPRLRELCVFLHEDRRELRNTVRHEGFHQYLHQFVESPPIWFNEGYAEYFGFSRRESGRMVTGQVGDDQAAGVAVYSKEFVPVRELVRLAPREFMTEAGPRYVQSWALIHLLRETKDKRLAGVLGRYTDAILAGKSHAEACTEILDPVEYALQRAFDEHVEKLLKADDR